MVHSAGNILRTYQHRTSNQRSAASATVGKADIGKACRLTDHFQLACLNLSHGLKWRAPAGADYNGPIMLFLLLFGTPSNSRD